MPISAKQRAIFVHIPKNAGTAVLHALGMGKNEGHVPWFTYERMDPRKWRKYFKFAIVRNPWERVVSNYLYARMQRSYWHSPDGSTPYKVHPDYETVKALSFAECIEKIPNLRHPGWRSQSYFVCNAAGVNMMDFLCRHERLEEDMAYVYRTLGVRAKLEQVNVTEKTSADWRSFYDEATVAAVRRLYAEDVEQFGYEFGSVEKVLCVAGAESSKPRS
jgi:chondroitin 4-sulfotransferase 11